MVGEALPRLQVKHRLNPHSQVAMNTPKAVRESENLVKWENRVTPRETIVERLLTDANTKFLFYGR